MKRYKQFAPVLIADFEVSRWKHPVHNHNHYELIYIKYGTGKHIVNKLCLTYQNGDVFLLGPTEEHYFEIDTRTRFVYLKFTDFYIHQKSNNQQLHIEPLEYLIKSRETHFPKFKFNDGDQHIVNSLFDLIIALKNDVLLNEYLLWMQVIALSILLQRNMPEIKAVASRGNDMQAVFSYIHKHVYTPENLKATAMAAHFNLAAGYIGPYFKRNTGMSLRNYIQEYRNSLIKKRLESGNYSLKHIADEFNLVDESHVSKLLKKRATTTNRNNDVLT